MNCYGAAGSGPSPVVGTGTRSYAGYTKVEGAIITCTYPAYYPEWTDEVKAKTQDQCADTCNAESDCGGFNMNRGTCQLCQGTVTTAESTSTAYLKPPFPDNLSQEGDPQLTSGRRLLSKGGVSNRFIAQSNLPPHSADVTADAIIVQELGTGMEASARSNMRNAMGSGIKTGTLGVYLLLVLPTVLLFAILIRNYFP